MDWPTGFLYGCSTAGFQIEGRSPASDWLEFAKRRETIKDRTLPDDQTDSFENWRDDILLLKQLGANSYRFSIEWARIMLSGNDFDERAIDNYRQMIASLKRAEIEPIVSLHHFVSPLWFSKLGGFEHEENIDYFLKFVTKVVDNFQLDIKLFITFNEPNVYIWSGWIKGNRPPERRLAFRKAAIVLKNLAEAHRRARKLINQTIRFSKVGIAHNFSIFSGPIGKTANFWWNDQILFAFRSADFLGLNFYCNQQFRPTGKTIDNSPEALKLAYREIKLRLTHLPILITEHGIWDNLDQERPDWLRQSLEVVNELAWRPPGRLLGYLHWSLLDSFEWNEGFRARFGLATGDRRIKESGQIFSELSPKKIIGAG